MKKVEEYLQSGEALINVVKLVMQRLIELSSMSATLIKQVVAQLPKRKKEETEEKEPTPAVETLPDEDNPVVEQPEEEKT